MLSLRGPAEDFITLTVDKKIKIKTYLSVIFTNLIPACIFVLSLETHKNVDVESR
jgi:hypothetical protein